MQGCHVLKRQPSIDRTVAVQYLTIKPLADQPIADISGDPDLFLNRLDAQHEAQRAHPFDREVAFSVNALFGRDLVFMPILSVEETRFVMVESRSGNQHKPAASVMFECPCRKGPKKRRDN
jgi:hypothetical protein